MPQVLNIFRWEEGAAPFSRSFVVSAGAEEQAIDHIIVPRARKGAPYIPQPRGFQYDKTTGKDA